MLSFGFAANKESQAQYHKFAITKHYFIDKKRLFQSANHNNA